MWIPSWVMVPAIVIAWPFYFMWGELPLYFIEGIDEFATGLNPVQLYWARKRLSQPSALHPNIVEWYCSSPYDELYEQTCGLD